jgi:hypothetical protein
MFRKELADVLKQTFWFLAAALIIPAIPLVMKFIKGSYLSIFFPVFQAGLLFWALFLGASFFGRERGQRAQEYALSLPFSRLGLLAGISLPRLIVLVALWKVYVGLSQGWGSSYPALALLGFSLIYFSLFAVSLSLSPLIENFLVLAIVSMGLCGLLGYSLFLIFSRAIRIEGFAYYAKVLFIEEVLAGIRSSPVLAFIFIVFLLILPFMIALIMSFRKFDLRPSRVFLKRYALAFFATFILVIPGVILIGLNAFSFEKNFRSYYLTSGQTLVEFGYKRYRIYRPDTVLRGKLSLWDYSGPLENGTDLYVFTLYNDLVRLDTTDGTARTLYSFARDISGFWNSWTYDGKIAFFSPARTLPSPDGGKSISLIVVEPAEKGAEILHRVPLDSKVIPKHAFPRIFGTGVRESRRFWLIDFAGRTKMPIRLWEDGKIEEIGGNEAGLVQSSFFVNGLVLLSDGEGMTLYRDGRNGFEPIKRIDTELNFDTPFQDQTIDPAPVKAIFGKCKDKIARLDLETYEVRDIAPIQPVQGAWIYAIFPERFYLVQRNDDARTLRISILNENGATLLREIKDVYVKSKGYTYKIQRHGIIVPREKKIEVYAFPDLKELRFKGL